MRKSVKKDPCVGCHQLNEPAPGVPGGAFESQLQCPLDGCGRGDTHEDSSVLGKPFCCWSCLG
jgi:hypothetical protein